MPEIQKELDGRYKDQNIQVLAISTGDPEWYMRAFKEELGVNFPWLSMDISIGTYFASLYEQYQLTTNDGHPTLMLLDADGIIRFRQSGLAGTGPDEINYREAFDFIGTLLEKARENAGSDIGNQVGQQAIDFTLSDVDGNAVTLSELYGQNKLILLSFWGTGCVECGSLVPGLFAQDMLNQYGSEHLTVIGIDQFTPLDYLLDFIRSQGITYPVVKDELGDVAWAYQASGEFIFLLLSPDGEILYRGDDFDKSAVEILDTKIGKRQAQD